MSARYTVGGVFVSFDIFVVVVAVVGCYVGCFWPSLGVCVV